MNTIKNKFDNRIITKAYLLGRLGKAVLWQHDNDFTDEYFTIDEEGSFQHIRAGEAAFLFDVALEYEALENPYLKDVQNELKRSTYNWNALTVAIDGFNSSLSERTRKFSIGLADEWLQEKKFDNYDFVSRRLLNNKLPDGSHIESAIELSKGRKIISELYEEVAKLNSILIIAPDDTSIEPDNKLIEALRDLKEKLKERFIVVDGNVSVCFSNGIVVIADGVDVWLKANISNISRQLNQTKIPVYIVNASQTIRNFLCEHYSNNHYPTLNLQFFESVDNLPKDLIV